MLQVHIESEPLPPKKQEISKSHHTFGQFFPFHIWEITSKNLRGKTSPSSIPMCLGLLAMRLHEVLGDASLLSQGCADYWAVWLATGPTLQRVLATQSRCYSGCFPILCLYSCYNCCGWVMHYVSQVITFIHPMFVAHHCNITGRFQSIH